MIVEVNKLIAKPAAAKSQAATVAAIPAFAVAPHTGTENYKDVELSQMRKVIAKRLSESKFSAPHFYLTIEVNISNAMAAHTQMNEISPVKISLNDMFLKAGAMALLQHPDVNSCWMPAPPEAGEEILFVKIKIYILVLHWHYQKD